MQDATDARRRLILLLLLLLNYFTFALITNIIGVLIPYWKSAFPEIDSTAVTLLGSAFFLAYAITSLPQGMLIDRFGSKQTFTIATVVIVLGSLLFAIFPNFTVGLISLFMIGTGVTAMQIIGNLLVKRVDTDPGNYSRNLTLAQVFCGIGGASGAFILEGLIGAMGGSWTSVYYLFALLVGIIGILGYFTLTPDGKTANAETKPKLSDYTALLRNPTMLAYAVGIFIYVGIEVGVANWISSFLLDAHNLTTAEANKTVSYYWLAQSVGRFTGGLLLNKLSPPRALVLYAVCCILCLAVAGFAPEQFLSSICFVGVGFFTSIMFPTIFSLAVNSFDKSQEGTVAGVLCMAIVGGAVTTPLIGLFQDLLQDSLALALLLVGGISFGYIAALGLKSWNQQADSPVTSK